MREKGIVEVHAVVAKTCDRCGIREDRKEFLGEWLEYTDTAGYFAKFFPDMTWLDLDLCESCKFQVLGPFIKQTNVDYDTWEVVSSTKEFQEPDDDYVI